VFSVFLYLIPSPMTTLQRRFSRHLFWLFLLFLFVAAPVFAERPPLVEVEGHPPAPGFLLEDLEGKSHDMAQYRGKVLIVNFWATWCPPCRAEMPSMERAWNLLRDEGVELVAISVGDTPEQVRAFQAETPVGFPLLLDRDLKVHDLWKLRGMPTTYVIDPEGRQVFRAEGGRKWDSPRILEIIRSLRPASPEGTVRS
jgi:peroxiredoxin